MRGLTCRRKVALPCGSRDFLPVSGYDLADLSAISRCPTSSQRGGE
jgi:hypothetical protein